MMGLRVCLAIGIGLAFGTPLPAQLVEPRTWIAEDRPTDTYRGSVPKLRLFGLHSDLHAIPEDEAAAPTVDDIPDCTVSYGDFYPFLDLRRPGDPTTMGYSKFYTRYGLFTDETAQIAVNLLALSPSNPQSGGVLNGATYFSPSITWTQDLGEGQAIHGFVGQNIYANGSLRRNLESGLLSGFAWQTAVPNLTFEGGEGLFFFLQAQAAYRSQPTVEDASNLFWDVFPGFAWRVNDACWLSVGASRLNFLSCSWQY